MIDKRMAMPAGMTAVDHDRIADDLAREAADLRGIVERIEARALAHRQTAVALRETYQAIREHNDDLARRPRAASWPVCTSPGKPGQAKESR